jgi:hypothetical protein
MYALRLSRYSAKVRLYVVGTRIYPDPSIEEHQMARTATRAAHAAADAAAAQLAAPSVRNTVAVSGGSATTGREPDGQRTAAIKAGPATQGAGPAAKFAKVRMMVRIPELAKWIAGHQSFTFAEAAAASAPSPCSPAVMAYTLADARLASALAELGYLTTPGGKNGHTVSAITAPTKPQAALAAKTPAGS